MLDRIAEAFARERRFTSDASHELRTPLSVIVAEADLALRTERAGEEYRRALRAIALEAAELESLTRDLLAAAREDAPAMRERAPVDLLALARSVAGRLAPIANGRRIEVSAPAAEATSIVRADPALLERALVAIVHNALKFSPPGGAVTVTVHAASVSVVDDGPGFSAQGLVRASERFWRDDDARARDGTGLGLAIARSIVERFDGNLVLENCAGRGAGVSIRFPATRDPAAPIA